MIVVKYKFNPNTYADLLPTFNSGYTSYTKSDVTNDDGTITRTIESNSLPTIIKFGYRDDTTNTKVAASSLLEVIELNTDNVNTTRDMFRYCTNLVNVNTTNWNFSGVTDTRSMFTSCPSLTSLDLNNWNTSKVTNMNYMFGGCASLTSLDLSNWDTSNVTDMSYMFYDCSSLTSLNISNWNTSNVTDMSYMFSECSSLTSLDVSNWNTSNVVDMTYMFSECSSLTSLYLNNWDTSNVTGIQGIFYNCITLTSLDLSNWNTNKVTDMNNVFQNCPKLRKINLKYSNESTISKIHENLLDRTDTTKGYILSPISLTLGKNWEILKTNYNEFFLPQSLRKVGDVKDRFYWDEDKGYYCIEQHITSTLEVLGIPNIIDLPHLNKKFTFDSYAPSTSIDIPNNNLKPSKIHLDAPIARYRCKILKPSTQYNVQFDCKGDSGIKVNLGGTEVTFTPTSDWSRKNLTITTPSELVNDKLSISNVGITSNNKVDNVMLFSEVIAQEPDYIDGIQSIGEFTESDTVRYRIEIETYDSRWDSI